MYPMLLNPVYKEIVWGGKLLRQMYNKDIQSDITGESWEIAAHPNGSSTIRNGRFEGRKLIDLVNDVPEIIYGTQTFDRFPLLFKIIDANQDLSVQVHPDDEMAKILNTGDIGKTEAWYILNNTSTDGLVAGLKPGTTKEIMADAISQGQVEALLTKQQVEVGQVINIPAGIVHAINQGFLIAEIQQTSDTTFRVYDYNRLGLDGQPRALHVDEAIAAIKYAENGQTFLKLGEIENAESYQLKRFVANEYFSLEELKLSTSFEKVDNTQLLLYFVVKGQVVIGAHEEVITANTGDSFMIPGSLSSFTLNGDATLLQIYVPK